MAASPYPLTGARTRTWAQKTYSEHTTIRPTTQQRLRSDDPAVFLARGETLREAFDRVAGTMVIVIPQLNTAGHFRVRRLRPWARSEGALLAGRQGHHACASQVVNYNEFSATTEHDMRQGGKVMNATSATDKLVPRPRAQARPHLPCEA